MIGNEIIFNGIVEILRERERGGKTCKCKSEYQLCLCIVHIWRGRRNSIHFQFSAKHTKWDIFWRYFFCLSISYAICFSSLFICVWFSFDDNVCIICYVHFRNVHVNVCTFCWICWQINRDKWHTSCTTLLVFLFRFYASTFTVSPVHVALFCDDTSVQTGKYSILL